MAFLAYDPAPEPRPLAERLAAKQRSLGASFAQIARHLGWDPGSLRRYLDGTWRISPDRGAVIRPMTPAEYTDFIRLERAKWGLVVKSSGAKME